MLSWEYLVSVVEALLLLPCQEAVQLKLSLAWLTLFGTSHGFLSVLFISLLLALWMSVLSVSSSYFTLLLPGSKSLTQKSL